MNRRHIANSIVLLVTLTSAAAAQVVAPGFTYEPGTDVRLMPQAEIREESEKGVTFAAAPPAALAPPHEPLRQDSLRQEPPATLGYDPSVDTWIGPETPSNQNWSPGTPITPGYSGIGGSGQGGFLHGGLWRMFWYGNGSYGEYRWSGAQWLCRAFNDWCPPVADPTPCYGVQAFSAYEAFRQIPDGTSRPHGNNGAVGGLNLAAPVPWLSQFGIGTQFGFSSAAYNWGNDTPQQTFVTTGIFRRATADRPISFGLVYDWMMNEGFGAFQTSPFLGQWRTQIAYAFSARNEIGIWGTFRDRGDTKLVAGGPVYYRAISQGDLFWHHKFGPGGADVWIWGGIPDVKRANGNVSYETMLWGGRLIQPLTDRISLFSDFQATRFAAPHNATPPATPTAGVSNEPIYSWMIGFNYYPGRAARSTTVAGQTWMPYMPVANNGSFLVDTDRLP